jgi:fucose 4-O-acetylase-like acetyltransferase
LGRFLVPLGQATLFVFIVHAFVIMVVRNVAVLDPGKLWWDAVTDTAVLATLWWIVRRRFLYRMILR